MRMWMLNPEWLCRQHLLGEHGELHKHRPSFVKRRSIAGRLGQIEPKAMAQRHDALAMEMLRRGYHHASPYELPDLAYLPQVDRDGQVDITKSYKDLRMRCGECRARMDNSLLSQRRI